MKTLFTQIQNTLAALQIASASAPNKPAYRYIDFDLGQLDDNPPPVSFPCALIAFGDSTFEQLGAGQQIQSATIVIRLAFKIFERTSSIAEAAWRAQALAHLDTLDATHNALHNIANPEFTALIRSGITNEQRADLRIYTLTYTTDIYQDTATTPDQNFTNWHDLLPAYPNPNGPNFCIHPVID